MNQWLVYTISSILLFSCGKKHDDGAISISLQKRDSLLIDYIAEEFSYDEYAKSSFWEQLKRLRQDTTATGSVVATHEVELEDYHFKSFLFDSQRKPPFVVEVTNKKGEFISFFSFTDEEYYGGNSITIKGGADKSEERDSTLQKKINLEYNLNSLAKRLNLNQNKEDMLTMVSLLCDLLEMNKTSEENIKHEIETMHSNAWINDSTYNLVKNEQSLFFKQESTNVLTVETQCGPGYWRFWIEESQEKLIIRTAFFSDILFVPTYM